jgi:hypothetical protein
MANTSLETVSKFCKNWNGGNIRCCQTAYRTAQRYLRQFSSVAPQSVIDTLVECIEYHNFHELKNQKGSMYI